MKIKRCGLTDSEGVAKAVLLGCNIIGLTLQKRCFCGVKAVLSNAGIIPDGANSDISGVLEREKVEVAGVFSDDMPQDVITHVVNYRLDYIQLDGHESPVYMENLRATLVPDIAPAVKLIKTLSPAEFLDADVRDGFAHIADMFLVMGDAPADVLKMAEDYSGTVPFMIDSRLVRDDIESLSAIENPLFVGVNIRCLSDKADQ